VEAIVGDEMPELGDLPEHFRLAPSSSYRWINCPGSLKYPKMDDPGEAAIIGTLGHEMVNAKLTFRRLGADDQAFFEGLSAYLQAELTNAVDLCANHIEELDYPIKLHEMKVPSNFLDEHGGTVDFAGINDKTIHVVDYKFGRGLVEVEDNPQIGCYLNLVRQRYPGRKKFVGQVIQPFNGGISAAQPFSLEFLEELERKVIRASISDEIKAGNHCRYCHLLPTCIVAAKFVHDEVKGVDLTQIVGNTGKPTEQEVEKLAKLFRVYKLAEKGAEGAGEILKRWARAGADLAKHHLAIRTTHRVTWAPNAEEELQRRGINPEDMYRKSLLTPNQLAECLGMSNDAFRADYKAAVDYKEVEALVMGKAGKKSLPEFD
jgi:hypothetical protein